MNPINPCPVYKYVCNVQDTATFYIYDQVLFFLNTMQQAHSSLTLTRYLADAILAKSYLNIHC